MKIKTAKTFGARVCFAMACMCTAQAQQRSSVASPRQTAYESTHETVLQGIVLMYSDDSSIPPIGAHATVQTAHGPVDVQLGPASQLRGNHFVLSPGDSVSFVGVSTTTSKGQILLARIVQKGNQSLVLRSSRGSLQARAAARVLPQTQRAHMAETVGPR